MDSGHVERPRRLCLGVFEEFGAVARLSVNIGEEHWQALVGSALGCFRVPGRRVPVGGRWMDLRKCRNSLWNLPVGCIPARTWVKNGCLQECDAPRPWTAGGTGSRLCSGVKEVWLRVWDARGLSTWKPPLQTIGGTQLKPAPGWSHQFRAVCGERKLWEWAGWGPEVAERVENRKMITSRCKLF